MNNAYIRAQQCKVKEAKFPFVKIGTQYWTKRNLDLSVTPQGNTIPEVQANGNVEKVVNGTNLTSGIPTTGVTINTNSFTSTGVGGVSLLNFKTIGKWYKLIIDGTTSATSISITDSMAMPIPVIIIGFGTFYFKATNVNIYIRNASAGTTTITTLSVQEIGWSGSQELYDGIYAQTAGTVEQKTYAAVKAAAMWCNYNNDAPTGLIYGKLYNWFAVKLFQMDIDYYNAANPTKPWGWRVPTQTEFQTLSTYLGGDAVSGGKLKEAGLAHWSSPNLGADNSSGFSCLGSGRRTELGAFDNLSGYGYIQTISEFSSTKNIFSYLSAIDATITQVANNFKARGYPIRLIKA